MIYIIKSGEYLKFGYATNVKRLSTYYTHNPLIELLHTIECNDIHIEQVLHKAFKDKLFNRKEWYYYSDELVADILYMASNVHEWYLDYEPKNKAVSKLQHGNVGRKISNETKIKMGKGKKCKPITFDNVAYNSIKECASMLGVSRQTIYRRMLSNDLPTTKRAT